MTARSSARSRAQQGEFSNRQEIPENAGKSLGRAVRYLGHYGRLSFIAIGSMLVATFAMLLVPQVAQNLTDVIVNGSVAQQVLGLPEFLQQSAVTMMQENMDSSITLDVLRQRQQTAERDLITAGLIMVGLAVVQGIFAFVQSYTSEYVSQSIAFDFRNELFRKIQGLSFSYHDKTQTGQLMVRATDDVEQVRGFIGRGLLMVLQAVVTLVGAIVLLAATNWQLTLVVIPILPIALVLFMIFGRVARPLFMEVQARLSHLNTLLQESLAGITVIKAFTSEKRESEMFEKSAISLRDQFIKVGTIFSFLFPLTFLTANVGQAAVTYFGGQQIIGGTLTLGEWQKFGIYLWMVFFPMGMLGFIISLASQAAASASRIFDILDTESEVKDKPDAQPLPEVQGYVTFEDVTFRYFSSGQNVLTDVNIEAEPGETVALLGATGSGKTTIINLIPRFYDVSEGAVKIDGQDVRDVKLEDLRSQIGIVLQETTLFTGSIRDNIAFGRPDATMEDVEEAAKAAAAHDFITSFEQGYDTPVGERGTTLSGGQKQRVAIARALLLNPKILILDDSTSSVDLATEVRIQRALDRLMKGRTSFVIAQRISTVMSADQILVLDKGQVVARGKHEELMASSPIYADIYHSQLVEDAEMLLEAEGEEA